MFASTKTLVKAAGVIEKLAHLIDAEEKRELEKKAAHIRKEYIEPLRDSLPNLNPELENKLASLDTDVLSYLKQVTSTRGGDYSSLGGPSQEKTASENDDALLAFILSDD